uniref:Uncharacterized protein n=1 Tax=Magallana gigas TaxID=29159 RepID=A0A8W8IGQ4_MAGGI
MEVLLLDGAVCFKRCIFFLSHFVTSRHILKPCPTKSSRVDSTIKAASIKNEDFIQHLLSRLNLFRNTTEKLREKYIPPQGRRITSNRTIDVLRLQKIMELDVTSPFSLDQIQLTNCSLLDIYRNLTLIASFLDLMEKDEDKYSHGELSSFIGEASRALYHLCFDLHTILRNGHCLSEAECIEIENIDRFRTPNNQYRFYRDFVILNESTKYADHIRSQSNAPSMV